MDSILRISLRPSIMARSRFLKNKECVDVLDLGNLSLVCLFERRHFPPTHIFANDRFRMLYGFCVVRRWLIRGESMSLSKMKISSSNAYLNVCCRTSISYSVCKFKIQRRCV